MKRIFLFGMLFVGLVTPAFTIVPQGPDWGDSNNDDRRIRRGFAIAPVPLSYNQRNHDLVGLGSYIVNAQADCAGCHSFPQYEPGGDPFLGEEAMVSQATYLSGGAPFFGPFVPRNITPDASGKPAGKTRAQFLQVLRTGRDLAGIPPHVPGPGPDNDLLQVMPWPGHRYMIDQDLRAIYEYLRAIPCLEGGVKGRCEG